MQFVHSKLFFNLNFTFNSVILFNPNNLVGVECQRSSAHLLVLQ